MDMRACMSSRHIQHLHRRLVCMRTSLERVAFQFCDSVLKKRFTTVQKRIANRQRLSSRYRRSRHRKVA